MIPNCKQKNINITTGVEYATNEYIDNKQVYRKRIDCGALPSDIGVINIPHNLQDVNFIRITGIASTNSGKTILILPYSNPNGISYGIGLSINANEISITTGIDRSAYRCYIDVYYTK